jgi:hypothetical protein
MTYDMDGNFRDISFTLITRTPYWIISCTLASAHKYSETGSLKFKYNENASLGEEQMANLKYMFLIVGLVSILIPISSPALAKSEIIRASYKYTMGDNDTKNDAKTLCFLGAKRRLLEQVGTFITSKTEVSDFKLTKDEITSYSAAFLKIEVENEKTEVTGETSAIVMTVKTNVDLDEIKIILNKIINDASLKLEVTEKNKKISLLEKRIQNLQKQLETTSYDKSFQLRNERKESIRSFYIENENIRNIVLASKERTRTLAEKKAKRDKEISIKVRAILQYVEEGMTTDEVKTILTEITGEKEFKREYIFNTNYHGFRWDELIFVMDKNDVLWSINYRRFGAEFIEPDFKNFPFVKNERLQQSYCNRDIIKYIWCGDVYDSICNKK